MKKLRIEAFMALCVLFITSLLTQANAADAVGGVSLGGYTRYFSGR